MEVSFSQDPTLVYPCPSVSNVTDWMSKSASDWVPGYTPDWEPDRRDWSSFGSPSNWSPSARGRWGEEAGGEGGQGGRRAEAYHLQPDPVIESLVDSLEQKAWQNTELYLEDGRLNPMVAPFIDTGTEAEAEAEADRSSAAEFWTWSVRMQRWYHEDKASDVVVLYPKFLF